MSCGATLCVFLSFNSAAWATIENLKSFKQTYPGKDPTYYSCKICHQAAVGRKGNLNAYGLALQKSKAPADAKELTKQDFRAIEKEDADGDGVSNIDEINAGTAPGDPTSVPASQPASAKETQPASTKDQEPRTPQQKEEAKP